MKLYPKSVLSVRNKFCVKDCYQELFLLIMPYVRWGNNLLFFYFLDYQITFLFAGLVIAKKVQVGNDQEKAQSPFQKPRWRKIN